MSQLWKNFSMFFCVFQTHCYKSKRMKTFLANHPQLSTSVQVLVFSGGDGQLETQLVFALRTMADPHPAHSSCTALQLSAAEVLLPTATRTFTEKNLAARGS